MNNLSTCYISTQQAAKRWSISRRRVLALCQAARIPDIVRVGNMWLIPESVEKPKDNRHFRYVDSSDRAKPFLKWAGGKTQLLENISVYLDRLDAIKKYAEPFVGGGALLFNVLERHNFEKVYISDINPDLINAYLNVRDNVDPLISELDKMQKLFLAKDLAERKTFYLLQRKKFNELCLGSKKARLEKAVLFIFLNKTCFNGLYRVNSKGEFNVPMGAYNNPTICDKKNLHVVSELLQNVEITCADYKQSLDFIDSSTFVYLDPPYRPLNNTSNFTAYTADLFTDEHQKSLADYIDCLSAKQAKVLLSNSDPHNHNPDDMFFDDLYAKYSIKRVAASRRISCNAESRRPLKELLISNF